MRFLIVTLATLSLFFVGCGGSKQAAPPKDESGMPSFVLNPPSAPGKIYGSGTAKKQSMELAMQIADLNAKVKIAQVLGQKISNMTKQFLQESGINSPEATEFSQSVTKAVTDQDLVGVVIEKREFIEGTCYTLAVLDLASPDLKSMVKKKVEGQLTSKEALLSEFRAKQGFEALDKELDKMQN
ncbi:MAG: hypothetical protein V1913_08935 [Fibrobacterota bacterium]